MSDLFKFWRRIDPADGVHPDDAPTFKRLNGQHGFSLNCLPLSFTGPLKTARVVLLYLSPGLPKGLEGHSRSPELQVLYAKQRTGTAELPDANSPGHRWRESRLSFLGDWEQHRDEIAVFNIGAYHSKEFIDHDVLASLPSSRIALDWAQSVLFPEAEAGNRVVICMRAAKYWGLRAGQTFGKSLFAPETTRGGHMVAGKQREVIIEKARRALGTRPQ
ncbi:hypothetical protein JQ617_02720 [Bradyrhizobium sp. KB893862 SZCCT0404]|uniref:hypothetical protein n=1 Tax=Bradyrhizobium sp. KB893862 SZCCT0404 TaxID=2807672 RepID=UPI001BA5F517|nr:hypothetical protein [Bradyrhizobium sp. KB893862 SZCCT0404]MBR1172856.1 hypothetical protein [Bradyrhizobium sp. KB893862 SZCCT0404]